jgi:hypothetical protein
MNLSKLKQSNPSKELVDEMRKLLKGRTGNTAYQTISLVRPTGSEPVRTDLQDLKPEPLPSGPFSAVSPNPHHRRDQIVHYRSRSAVATRARLVLPDLFGDPEKDIHRYGI